MLLWPKKLQNINIFWCYLYYLWGNTFQTECTLGIFLYTKLWKLDTGKINHFKTFKFRELFWNHLMGVLDIFKIARNVSKQFEKLKYPMPTDLILTLSEECENIRMRKNWKRSYKGKHQMWLFKKPTSSKDYRQQIRREQHDLKMWQFTTLFGLRLFLSKVRILPRENMALKGSWLASVQEMFHLPFLIFSQMTNGWGILIKGSFEWACHLH
jgi:hypothetical protein